MEPGDARFRLGSRLVWGCIKLSMSCEKSSVKPGLCSAEVRNTQTVFCPMRRVSRRSPSLTLFGRLRLPPIERPARGTSQAPCKSPSGRPQGCAARAGCGPPRRTWRGRRPPRPPGKRGGGCQDLPRRVSPALSTSVGGGRGSASSERAPELPLAGLRRVPSRRGIAALRCAAHRRVRSVLP